MSPADRRNTDRHLTADHVLCADPSELITYVFCASCVLQRGHISAKAFSSTRHRPPDGRQSSRGVSVSFTCHVALKSTPRQSSVIFSETRSTAKCRYSSTPSQPIHPSLAVDMAASSSSTPGSGIYQLSLNGNLVHSVLPTIRHVFNIFPLSRLNLLNK